MAQMLSTCVLLLSDPRAPLMNSVLLRKETFLYRIRSASIQHHVYGANIQPSAGSLAWRSDTDGVEAESLPGSVAKIRFTTGSSKAASVQFLEWQSSHTRHLPVSTAMQLIALMVNSCCVIGKVNIRFNQNFLSLF